ncbi:hypothetical protein PAXRUDRAFT_830705 [Paxillus rubicundulus Ve08.2h10]|uniref:Mitochondrial K+-H+ exchange-related-domain-containing protein n=1 Tax=Paxillus rubicundulus Ve08.2h10 TaxID=930991 RepID=A0A0D0E3G6_9AGAM|nr:hypothetical protein PAXRUDRAFT_830705 [Paxillus rubicundulus Ve08.2h10]
MAVVQMGRRLMRIIALPLAKAEFPPKPHTALNTNKLLIYYHFNLVSPCGVEGERSWAKIFLTRLATKAADIWANFGKAPEGSWKLHTYEYGERMVDRIDFEELALKGVDPSLGPVVTRQNLTTRQVEDIPQDSILASTLSKVPLIYPPSIYPASLATSSKMHSSLAHLRTLLSNREPRHRRGFYMWMLIAPLTIPFMLIPIIPNLPFFFCAWRSWSHYKAYRSSQYLSSLLDHGLIVPTPSPELDKLYASFSTMSQHSPSTTAPSSEERSEPENNAAATHGAAEAAFTSGASPSSSDSHYLPQRLFLTRKAIPQILELFNLPESAGADMYRAVEQVRRTPGRTV